MRRGRCEAAQGSAVAQRHVVVTRAGQGHRALTLAAASQPDCGPFPAAPSAPPDSAHPPCLFRILFSIFSNGVFAD
ncbi:hypothetical protein BCEN4_1530004 [Burkholderia cenocepacia]|nr:hypothetical protein BCEN4_1530004 [Burkholderia cenocepacia]